MALVWRLERGSSARIQRGRRLPLLRVECGQSGIRQSWVWRRGFPRTRIRGIWRLLGLRLGLGIRLWLGRFRLGMAVLGTWMGRRMGLARLLGTRLARLDMTRGGVLTATSGTRQTATNTALRMRHRRTIPIMETTTLTDHPMRRRSQIPMTTRRRQRQRTISLRPPNPRPTLRLLRQLAHRPSPNRRRGSSQFPSCSTAAERHAPLSCAGCRVSSIRPTRGAGISYAI